MALRAGDLVEHFVEHLVDLTTATPDKVLEEVLEEVLRCYREPLPDNTKPGGYPSQG